MIDWCKIFEVHTRKINRCASHPDIDASGSIVLTILKHVERNKGHKLFMQNCSTGIPLLATFMSLVISIASTVRSNQLKKGKMPSDKDMRDNGRGSFAMKSALVDNIEICAIKWIQEIDNQLLTILTSYETAKPLPKAKRGRQ